jgi:hypothetical protein
VVNPQPAQRKEGDAVLRPLPEIEVLVMRAAYALPPTRTELAAAEKATNAPNEESDNHRKKKQTEHDARP